MWWFLSYLERTIVIINMNIISTNHPIHRKKNPFHRMQKIKKKNIKTQPKCKYLAISQNKENDAYFPIFGK